LRTDMEALELLDADRNAMFAEAIDHIIALWTGEAPYNLTGKYWNISTAKTLWPEIGLGGVVKPYQKPHPPIIGTATDPVSKGLIALGRRGWWPVSSHFLHANWLLNQWNNYAQGCAEGGHKADRANWRVARSIFVADDDKVARSYGGDDAKSPYRFYMRQLTAKLKKGNKLGGFKERMDIPDEDLTLDYIFDNVVIRGSVNRVVDGLLALHEKIGDFGTLLYCGKDWTDPALARRSMELMAEKVMPAVNSAIGKRVAAE
jgi:alkanesulfonate monooxygenase SsuD/methylene tetrahydromethanopterin reductase-like flavin-dependent oxidoreductase (luciferase family)